MYPCVEQGYYGVVSAYGSQSRVMLPLNMETEDGTIFVNSKQYHAIIRRRQSRAKAAAVLSGGSRKFYNEGQNFQTYK